MAEEILANKNNIKLCRETLLNNIQVLIESYIFSPYTDTTVGNRNMVFNILFARNIIVSLEDDDLLQVIEDTNSDVYDILNLKSLHEIPENEIRPN
jgi:hypothetical protein